MGVSIRFPSTTLDCGYFGFKRLRDFVIKLVPHENFKKAHEDFENHMFFRDDEFLAEINKKINDIDYLANEGSSNEEKKHLAYVNNFSWASDCESKMKPAHAKAIWHYIENATEDFSFGYSTKPDCATFQQFKQCIKECVDKNKGFYWF